MTKREGFVQVKKVKRKSGKNKEEEDNEEMKKGQKYVYE